MKFRTHHFIIALLVFLLIMQGGTEDCPVESSVTTVTQKITTAVDSVENTGIKDKIPEKVAVIETPETVRIVDPVKLPEAEKKQVKKVNRYRDTTYLQGAVIYSDILAEGRILRKDLKTEIEHTETLTTTTKTLIKQPGGLFLSPGIDYSPIFGVEKAEIGLTYLKGNLGLTAAPYVGFNFKQGSSLGMSFKIHIKI